MRVMSIALLTSLLLLSACGQKGPLYLPQDQNLDTADVNSATK
ncbi:MAG: lipoprotein [Spongiibacteraceae bacterium]